MSSDESDEEPCKASLTPHTQAELFHDQDGEVRAVPSSVSSALCSTLSKLKYRLDSCGHLIGNVLKERGWAQVEGESSAWDLFWCELGQLRSVLDNRRLNANQRVPHFRNHYELTKKNLLARNLQRLKKSYLRENKTAEAQLCDCMPTTFELPTEYLMFVEHFRNKNGGIWIVKPAAGCQGRGIFLFRKLKDLVDWRNSRECSAKDAKKEALADGEKEPPPDTWVVQHYIDNPYLLAGRKFDLRLYVLVMAFMPLRAWVCRDGFARLSGSQFDLNEISDHTVHLTNMAIQLGPKQDPTKKGCKWSLRQLREFLTGRHGACVVESLVQKIGQLVLTSLRSVQRVIMHNKHCFELYGYDILLDNELNPWLLEINASPSLAATDNVDLKLKHNMLEDVLNVVDLEGSLTGQEIRVGGFDLLWDDGPVHAPCPGATDSGPVTNADMGRLNIFLGCLNDRTEQLEQLHQWGRYMSEVN